MTEKLCPRCFQIKPVEDFYPDTRGKEGRAHVCKSCHPGYQREGRRRYREAAAAARKRNRHIPAIVSNAGSWSGLAPCDQRIVPQLLSVFEQIDGMGK